MALQQSGSGDPASLSGQVNPILTGIRIPELPYPVGQPDPAEQTDWRGLLLSCWKEQRDESVIEILRALNQVWTVRQVNAAYLSDRIMDVFLRLSGLHPTLVSRVARLRFFLAWRMDDGHVAVIDQPLLDWLDSLADWRGWSDSGGRSARVLLDQLGQLQTAVIASFDDRSLAPFSDFAGQWHSEAHRRHERTDRLHQRLLETEQGASRQRRAEQAARAIVGRALKDRNLPGVIIDFVFEQWMPLLRQIAWNDGVGGENWKHASKLLEWLVWVGDTVLSDQDRNRLYQVGEQLADRISDVWKRVQGQEFEPDRLQGVEALLVARLRGEDIECHPAMSDGGRFQYDVRWLTLAHPKSAEVAGAAGQWYMDGSGISEQRRFFLAVLDDTAEVLWTNGYGVKLGLMPWAEFLNRQQQGEIRSLPPLNAFGEVLEDTVSALGRVLSTQREQREKAAADARQRAEDLRRQKAEAERLQLLEAEARAAEDARRRAEQQAQLHAEEAAALAQKQREDLRRATAQVEAIKLGGWVVLAPETDRSKPVSGDIGVDEPMRLKLAVRINASRKLIFVDRLGFNRTEYTIDALSRDVASGRVRVLGSAAEFDETLSRVVGRIRVGRP